MLTSSIGPRYFTCGLISLALSFAATSAGVGQTYIDLVFNDPTPTKVGPEPDLTVGATYVFEDVASGVDAVVEILSLEQGAFLERIDDHAEPTPTDLFYPRLGGNPSLNPRVTFEVSLVDSVTSAPEFLDFRWTLADLDSSESGNGTIFEVGIMNDIGNYTLEGDPTNPSNLTHTSGGPGVHLFSSNPIIENFTGVNLTDTEVMVLASYTNTSVFSFGFGLEGTQTSNTRNVAASGLPTVIDNFVDPVTTTTPEPGTPILLALGALLAGRRRRSELPR